MSYRIEATTTKEGNVLKFKVYQLKGFLNFPYWSFMCNQSTFEDAEKLISNLQKINNTKQ